MSLRIISLLLTFLVGLHLPKAFTLLYLLYLLLAWQTRKVSIQASGRIWILVPLFVFSIGYVWSSLHYGFWTLLSRDALDLISMILLPCAGVWLGSRLAECLTARQLCQIWLAYGLGALLYVWITLLFGRVDDFSSVFNIWLHHRDLTIPVPWGEFESMNVRSVEQNASFAVSWFLPSLWLLMRGQKHFLPQMLALIGPASLLAVLAFHGRIGILVGILSLLPVAWAIVSEHQKPRPLLRFIYLVLSSLVVFLSISLLSLLWGVGDVGSRILARVYDERIDRIVGFWPHLQDTIWGGQALTFQYFDQQRQVLVGFDAASGDLLHSVPLDLLVRSGLIPSLAVSLAMSLLYWRSLSRLLIWLQVPSCRPDALIASGFLIALTVQWLFQPLMYADGLLFYFGFLFLGALAFSPVHPGQFERDA